MDIFFLSKLFIVFLSIWFIFGIHFGIDLLVVVGAISIKEEI